MPLSRKLAERIKLRMFVWHSVEPRMRGLVSFLLEQPEDVSIPYDYMLVNITTRARGHLVIMMRGEFNLSDIPKMEWIKWYTYADAVRFVVKRIEHFRL